MPVLVVQLGHCYRRTGATGTTGEQEYATKVGNACRALLHGRGGWSVRVILADDPASSYVGHAFFAIHCDGSTSPAARGASVGYRTPEGQAAAQAWKRAYAARGWPGFRPDNYTTALAQYYGTGTAVARGNRRAVILECGFRTNAEDRGLLDSPGGPERVALSIGDALGIPVTPPEEDVELGDKIRAWDGFEITVGQALFDTWQLINNLSGRPTRPGKPADTTPWVLQLVAEVTTDPDITQERLAEIVRDNSATVDPAALAAQLLGPLQETLAGLDSVSDADAEQIAQATARKFAEQLGANTTA
jgi:hypothetical protein